MTSSVVTPAPYVNTIAPVPLAPAYASNIISPPVMPIAQTIVPYPPVTPIVSPPYMSVMPQPPLVATVAPVASVASIPAISAVTPMVAPPLSTQIVAPTSVMGGNFASGGFNLFGDADPISPGYQSTPGIVSAVGPTRFM